MLYCEGALKLKAEKILHSGTCILCQRTYFSLILLQKSFILMLHRHLKQCHSGSGNISDRSNKLAISFSLHSPSFLAVKFHFLLKFVFFKVEWEEKIFLWVLSALEMSYAKNSTAEKCHWPFSWSSREVFNISGGIGQVSNG